MWGKITALCAVISAWVVVFILGKRDGRKSEQIKQLTAEAERTLKERERADKINNRVSYLSDGDVCERLQNVASKQR